MVDFRPPFIRRCKIVQNKIVFCTLHKQAETLLAVCDYLQKFIRDVKLGETKDEIFVVFSLVVWKFVFSDIHV